MPIEVLRPGSTVQAGDLTVVDSTAHGATSDDDDNTWLEGATTAWHLPSAWTIVGNEAHSLASGAGIVACRLRARYSSDDGGRNEVALWLDDEVGHWRKTISTSTIVTFVSGWRDTRPTDGEPWTPDDVAAAGLAVRHETPETFTYELWFEVDYREKPDVTLVAPSGTVDDTSRPTIEWMYDAVDGDNDPQDRFQVRVYHGDDEPSGGWPADPDDIDGDPAYTADLAVDTETHTVEDHLSNDATYRVYVRVRKQWVGSYDLWSDWESGSFTLDLDVPAAPQVTLTGDPDRARVRVDVRDPGAADALYREGRGEDGWVEGSAEGDGTAAKLDDALKLTAEAASDADAWRTWVTDAPVNFDDVDEVHVRWSADLVGQNGVARLVVGTKNDGPQAGVEAEVSRATPFLGGEPEDDVVDVSAVSGSHHVRVHAEADDGDSVNMAVGYVGFAAPADRFVVDHRDGDGEWLPLRAFDGDDQPVAAIEPDSAGEATVFDHEAPLNAERDYRARGLVVDGDRASDPTVVAVTLDTGNTRWLKDPRDPTRNTVVRASSQRATRQGRQEIHRPVKSSTKPKRHIPAVVEAEEPSGLDGQIDVVVRSPDEYDRVAAMLDDPGTLLLQDRRHSRFVRFVDSRDREQRGPDDTQIDVISARFVETTRPTVDG